MQLAKDLSAAVGGGRQRAERQPRPEGNQVPRDLNLPKRRSGRNAGVAAPNYNENALDNIKETTSSSRMHEAHGVPHAFF